MYQQLWGYKVEEKLYLGAREQKKKVEYHCPRREQLTGMCGGVHNVRMSLPASVLHFHTDVPIVRPQVRSDDDRLLRCCTVHFLRNRPLFRWCLPLPIIHNPEERGSRHLCKVGQFLWDYKAQHQGDSHLQWNYKLRKYEVWKRKYSYEITSWLMQGMRDAIVSGSGYYHCVYVLRVPKILVASVGLAL
jgi:hypothetical protein